MDIEHPEQNRAGEGERVGVTVLGSGSKGNCTIIHYGQQAIMIDAGFSCRETQRRFRQCGYLSGLSLQGILVTHEHTDHISGLRLCSERFEAPIYATSPCARSIRDKERTLGQMACFVPGGSFSIGRTLNFLRLAVCFRSNRALVVFKATKPFSFFSFTK